MKGLKSVFGRRGSICEHFGWTFDYLQHGISWSVVQRMLADAPRYDYESEGKKCVRLSQENAQSISNFINSLT